MLEVVRALEDARESSDCLVQPGGEKLAQCRKETQGHFISWESHPPLQGTWLSFRYDPSLQGMAKLKIPARWLGFSILYKYVQH